jgi:hypothetical protein
MYGHAFSAMPFRPCFFGHCFKRGVCGVLDLVATKPNLDVATRAVRSGLVAACANGNVFR